ncbi:hypothetical protein BX661DRAFT_69319 [Kickxella alabastrina]|uniref:uncharacterized protein n=1 Tax=Kickxella alabastrina TaxID=61397 RepID=UPI00221FF6EF|nr:uncharacterized protein BX661DRAFT_69319 [Kickxella alabastrina]KAI7820891.1 hypothetical protein BX661DRAFT_69319 [Kickxella alabastrina]
MGIHSFQIFIMLSVCNQSSSVYICMQGCGNANFYTFIQISDLAPHAHTGVFGLVAPSTLTVTKQSAVFNFYYALLLLSLTLSKTRCR